MLERQTGRIDLDQRVQAIAQWQEPEQVTTLMNGPDNITVLDNDLHLRALVGAGGGPTEICRSTLAELGIHQCDAGTTIRIQREHSSTLKLL